MTRTDVNLAEQVSGVLPIANGGTGSGSGIGMLAPVQAHTDGSETYTIVSGSVTQITGTTIQSAGSYSPSVGDRILIMGAPASTGVGSHNTVNTTNGVYVVTSNTTNLSLSRAADMSGSINPAGLTVYSEKATLGWTPQSIWTVTTPSSAAAFTYGSGNIAWGQTSGRTLFPVSIYLSATSGQVGMFNGANDTYVQSTANAPEQILTLPGIGNATIIGINMCRLHAAYTLTSTTSVQQLFNSSTNGTITLPVGVYRFKALYSLSAMSTGSADNSSFSLAGAATLANILMYTVGVDAVIETVGATQNGGMVVTSAFPASQHSGTVSAAQQSLIEGTFEVTVAGTVIPSIKLATAAPAVVAAGSFFEIWQAAPTAATATIGAWT